MRSRSIPLLLGAALFMGWGAAISGQAGAQSAAPATAPAKPYKTVTVTLPEPMKDASFEAFRKKLAEIAQKKDRAALAKLLAPDFFWQAEDGEKADRKKPPIENLSAAIGLGGREPIGWDLLVGYANDPTAAPFPDKPNTVCAPADPSFDDRALEDLAKSTQTDPSEWGYPLSDGVEVRGIAKTDAPVTEKLGLNFVRVMPDDTPPASAAPMVRVVTPSGKVGYVAVEAIAPLGNDQICYVKDGADWKIAGFIGGDQ